jgi:hypothetical protein
MMKQAEQDLAAETTFVNYSRICKNAFESEIPSHESRETLQKMSSPRFPTILIVTLYLFVHNF